MNEFYWNYSQDEVFLTGADLTQTAPSPKACSSISDSSQTMGTWSTQHSLPMCQGF